MRIAIFAETYFPFISGVVTHIQTLREGLEAAGHKVLIVTLSPTATKHYIKDNVLYCPAIPLKKIYGYGVANPVNLQRYKILKKFNPDIIHLHTEFSMGLFALYAAKRMKKPVVYTLHTMYDDYVFYLFPQSMDKVAKPAAHAYIRNVAAKATEIIGPSVKVANYLERCGVQRYIHIVPNTVDLSAFIPENVNQDRVKEIQKQLGIQADDIAMCFVGRLGPEKSIDVLIDYFAGCFKGQEKFKLFVIGDGPDKDKLNHQIKALGVESQIRLLGRIEHEVIAEYYNACQLFGTASLTEMNSISMLEATAAGLYVVHRLDVFNRDQIHSGVNGEVFENQQEFCRIVNDYAKLNSQQREERRKAVSSFARRYGTEEFTKLVLDIYEQATQKYAEEKRWFKRNKATKVKK